MLSNLSVRRKFLLSTIITVLYTTLAVWLALAWFGDLHDMIGWPVTILIIAGIALVPGALNTFLVVSSVVGVGHEPEIIDFHEPITLLIAAYNEEDQIYRTIRSISNQNYLGPIRVLVIDNNSTDDTDKQVSKAAADFSNVEIELLHESAQGKFHALNAGLARAETELIITLDADTTLDSNAVRCLISRMRTDIGSPAAVAGNMLVRNPQDTWLTRMQEWDYFLSIGAIKRMQGVYHSTLVAEGAFSIYRTDIVREIGGWTDSIGEDIVLTWGMLKRGYAVHFSPRGVGYTEVPARFRQFTKQRARWARGMIEGLKHVKPWEFKNRYARIMSAFDIGIFYMDIAFTFAWIPGVLLAFMGYWFIAGVYTLLVFPLTFATFLLLYWCQRHYFNLPLNWGIVPFMLVYQLVISPVSLVGYAQEFFALRRTWE